MYSRIAKITLCVVASFGVAIAQNAGIEITQINVNVSLVGNLLSNQVGMDFDVENTLTAPVTVENIAGSFGSLGLPIITFNHSFTALTLPASGTANSGIIPNATLTLGALSEVQLLLLRQLDVQNVAVTLRHSLQQSGVSANLSLSLT